MFQLAKQQAVLEHISQRLENHGEEKVLALDLKFSADVENLFLDSLSPGLRSVLYERGDQADIDSDHLTKVRFPLIEGPMHWMGEAKDAVVVLHGRTKDLSLDFTGDVNQLRLSPKDGGTLAIVFRVQILPEPSEVGDLSALLGKAFKVSVKPAAPENELPLG